MQGKSMLVTRVSGVLGAAVAKLAAERGAQVAGVDLAPVEEAMALKFDGVDLSDLGAAQAVMDEIRVKAGRIDALLYIAGRFRWQTLAEAASNRRIFSTSSM